MVSRNIIKIMLKIIIIMMSENELHKGEFILKMVFLCRKLYNNGLKIEGSLDSG